MVDIEMPSDGEGGITAHYGSDVMGILSDGSLIDKSGTSVELVDVDNDGIIDRMLEPGFLPSAPPIDLAMDDLEHQNTAHDPGYLPADDNDLTPDIDPEIDIITL